MVKSFLRWHDPHQVKGSKYNFLSAGCPAPLFFVLHDTPLQKVCQGLAFWSGAAYSENTLNTGGIHDESFAAATAFVRRNRQPPPAGAHPAGYGGRRAGWRAHFVQLREKEVSPAALLEEARALAKLCHARHVPFVVDDNVEVALAAGADGVHVGQSDMAAKRARALLGPDKILGVSAHSAAEALAAQADGADYLGCGAAFVTGTKLDAHPVTAETMRAVTAAVNIPVVATAALTPPTCCSCRAGGWPVWPLSAPFLPRPTPALPARELYRLAGQL